ncbi:MAG: PGF-CTERM-anchored ABC transporter substrate-binding protein [Haloquadratum sp.]
MRFKTLVLSLLLVVGAAGPAAGAVGADEAAPSPGAVDTATTAASHQGSASTCTFPYTATDATGTEVTIGADPDRVVTLNPSAAQTMWEIGAREEVVGVSTYASYLEGADTKANVSGGGGPSVEAVLAAKPDLVLVPNSTHGFAPERVAKIRAQGVPVFVFGQATSLAYVANKTERIGRLTGNCAAGRERAAEMRRSIDLMRRVLEGEPRPVGLNVFYGYTSGANTFIGDVMETAGLQNGAAAAGITGFKPINDETVVAMDPAWIVVPEGSPVPENAAYNSTTAVRTGQIVRVNANYLQQPAPRSVRAAETILERVHPDAYKEYRRLQTSAEATTVATSPPATSPTAVTSPTTPPTEGTDAPATSTGTPGFGPAVALFALAATTLVAIRG